MVAPLATKVRSDFHNMKGQARPTDIGGLHVGRGQVRPKSAAQIEKVLLGREGPGQA